MLIGNDSKYNLSDVKLYPRTIKNDQVVFNPFRGKMSSEHFDISEHPNCENNELLVRILLPPRSLLILYGAARFTDNSFP
jgi:hypothetical protein